MALITFTDGEVKRIQDTTSIEQYDDRIEIISGQEGQERERIFYLENVQELEIEADESVKKH